MLGSSPAKHKPKKKGFRLYSFHPHSMGEIGVAELSNLEMGAIDGKPATLIAAPVSYSLTLARCMPELRNAEPRWGANLLELF